MRACAIGLLLAPLLLAAGPGHAQQSYGRPFAGDGPDVTGSVLGGPGYGRDYPPRVGPQVCQKWCEADFVPCDPPNFKIADGRCRPNTGRF